MEILQKLVAVALVSIIDSKDALQLSLAITLGMAATCGLVQPYLQPQVGGNKFLGECQLLKDGWNFVVCLFQARVLEFIRWSAD